MIERIDIYDIVSRTSKYRPLIEKGSVRKFLLMTEDYVKLVFTASKKIAFGLGDYVNVEDYGKFEITTVQRPKYNGRTNCYEYELQFDAPYFKWNNKKYKFEPAQARNEITWSLTDTIANHMAVFCRNLAHYGWNYTVDTSTMSEEDRKKVLLVQFDNIFILDALTKIAEAWGVEWWITDNIIHLGRVDNGGTYTDFEIGVNVDDMNASDSSGKEYCTVLYAFGSEKNLPSNYRRTENHITVNGIVQKRLMMPADTPYIALPGITKDEQRVEGVVIFDDIMPKTEDSIKGTPTPYQKTIEYTDESTGETVRETATFYRFKATNIKFSRDYVLPNQTLQIVFTANNPSETGNKLAGMTFDVVFNPDKKAEKKTARQNGVETTTWNDEAQVFEIVRNDNYGLFLPNDTLKPSEGDTFCLLNWDVTKLPELGLIESAERKVKERAEAYMEKLQLDPNNYTCPMMADYMAGVNDDGILDPNFAKSFDLGDRIRLVNANYFDSGSRESRCIGYEYQLDIPYDGAKVIVGENVTYNRFKDLQSSLDGKFDEVNYQNNTYTNGNSGSNIYVITSNDNTVESDHNVYSAKRTLQRFARKTEDDNISSLWTFQHGGIRRRGIRTKDYENPANEDNLFGRGFELVMKENGMSRLEVDELFARVRFLAASLEIRQMSYVGGNYVFSAAGSKVYFVEMFDEDGNYLTSGVPSYYRCYLYSDNGTTATTNRWVQGDQALCQTFNINNAIHATSNKRYWRLAKRTGKGLIRSKAIAALTEEYQTRLAALNDIVPMTDADASSIASDIASLTAEYNANVNSARNGEVPDGYSGEDFTEYEYVDLSNEPDECETGSAVPEAEDSIVQFGNQNDNSGRQGLVFIKVEGEGSPAVIVYDAIKEFKMPTGSSAQLSPLGNFMYGKFYSVVNGGKLLDDIIDAGDIRMQIVALCEKLWKGYSASLKIGTHQFSFNFQRKIERVNGVSVVTVFDPGEGDFYYSVEDNAVYRYVESTWENQNNSSLVSLAKSVHAVIGDMAVKIYSAYPQTASDYDICLRGTSYYDGFSRLAIEGSVEISLYHDEAWEILKESVNGVIENLGDRIRAVVYGPDGSSGIVARIGSLEAFSERITFDTDGNITNINKSGLATTAYVAKLFNEFTDADGNVLADAHLSAYITTDDLGEAISHIEIKANMIDLQGQVTANGGFKIDENGNIEATNAKISGEINATTGSIGAWKIATNGLYNNGNAGITLSYSGRKAVIGGEVTSASIVGIDAVAKFENKATGNIFNMGVIVDVQNAIYNRALDVTGTLTCKGVMEHWPISKMSFTAKNQNFVLSDNTASYYRGSQRLIISTSYSNDWVILPTLTYIREILGVSSGVEFTYKITYIANSQNTSALKIYGRCSDFNTDNYPYRCFDGGRYAPSDENGFTLSPGAAVEFLLCYHDSVYEAYEVGHTS